VPRPVSSPMPSGAATPPPPSLARQAESASGPPQTFLLFAPRRTRDSPGQRP
jgi:hypothetical protein